MVAPALDPHWPDDALVSRVTRALAFASTLLLSATATGATSSSSVGDSLLTTPEWTSATSDAPTTGDHLMPSALRWAGPELERASRVLQAIRGDVSSPAVEYLESLGELLAPYEDATTLSLQDLARITVGLEGAWAALVRNSTATPLLMKLAHIDPTIEERLSPLDKLARHPRSPIIENRADLSALLSGNPELVGLIWEALCAASDVFGERATFQLEPFVDPESPNPSTRAYLVLRTGLSVDEADRLMEDLDERWWLDNSHRVDGLLSLALEYV